MIPSAELGCSLAKLICNKDKTKTVQNNRTYCKWVVETLVTQVAKLMKVKQVHIKCYFWDGLRHHKDDNRTWSNTMVALSERLL
jgi:hypothetical protein